MPAQKSPNSPSSIRFSIGRAGMDKINAIEGIKRSAESQRMFADFDKKGLGQEQRRRALIAAHTKKA